MRRVAGRPRPGRRDGFRRSGRSGGPPAADPCRRSGRTGSARPAGQDLGQCFGHASLARPGRSGQQQYAGGPVGIAQPRVPPPQGVGQLLDGLLLPVRLLRRAGRSPCPESSGRRGSARRVRRRPAAPRRSSGPGGGVRNGGPTAGEWSGSPLVRAAPAGGAGSGGPGRGLRPAYGGRLPGWLPRCRERDRAPAPASADRPRPAPSGVRLPLRRSGAAHR